MFTYYVKVDEETKFIVSQPALEAADGLVAVMVMPSSKDWFVRYWAHYQVKGGIARGDDSRLPDFSIDHLQGVIDDQAEQLESKSKELATAQATITQLQMLSFQSTQSQIQAQATATATQADVDKLKKLSMQTTMQVLAMTSPDGTKPGMTSDTTTAE